MRKIRLGYIGEINNFKGTDKELLDCFNLDEIGEIKTDIDLTESHTRVTKGQFDFLVFNHGNRREVYKIMPNVDNDGIFQWKNTLSPHRPWTIHAKIECGLLRFWVNYHVHSGDVRINVYTNQTKMSCLIDIIYLQDIDADNGIIFEAIEHYVQEFKNKANNMSVPGLEK